MRRSLLAGNWKMFKTAEEAVLFAKELSAKVSDIQDRDILICPPYVYIQRLINAFSGSPVKIGSQNVFWEDEGAYTGEISAPMLKGLDVSACIIGHSERRQYFSETDETVNKRLKASLKADLLPIVCVGETLQEREAGKTIPVVKSQLSGGLKDLQAGDAGRIVIAYEPVWAIGTGRTATPEIAQEVHAAIRSHLADLFGKSTADTIRILYGGSVKPDNIDALMAKADIDGALVGGASLDASSFERIIRYRG
jgi:triosephosphate isomerase (TIM)